MVILAANSSENLVAANHFLRDREPWTPFLGVHNGLDDLYGLLCLSGSNNSVIGNHFSEVIDIQSIRPPGARPVIIRLMAGGGNYVSNNHVVGINVDAKSSSSAFSAQVDALLTVDASRDLVVTAVLVDSTSVRNIILDSGEEACVDLDKANNAFRATPTAGFGSAHSQLPLA
jgi:inulin fructotransferase (DFA-I-forming)